MSSVVDNELTIENDENSEISKEYKKILNIFLRAYEKEDDLEVFGKYIPIVKLVSPEEETELRREFWGTPSEPTKIKFIENNENFFKVTFETEASPPENFYNHLMALDLEINAFYRSDEGRFAGYLG